MVLNGLDISDPFPLFVIRSMLKLIFIRSSDLVLAFFCMELSGGCILLFFFFVTVVRQSIILDGEELWQFE